MRVSVALTTLAAAATLAAPALADGGYFAGAQGARAAGRSGAFVARADDPTAIMYNPAGLAGITEVAEAQNLLAGAEYQDAAARVDVWRALLAQAAAQGTLTSFVELLRPSGAQ